MFRSVLLFATHLTNHLTSRVSMSFTVDHGEEAGNRMYVYFCGEKNVSKAAMKT